MRQTSFIIVPLVFSMVALGIFLAAMSSATLDEAIGGVYFTSIFVGSAGFTWGVWFADRQHTKTLRQLSDAGYLTSEPRR